MNASEATGRRDFLLKEYDNLSSFYRYDLSTRFSVIRLYSGIVLAITAINAFLVKDASGVGIDESSVRVFACVMYGLSLVAGLHVVESLIATKRTLLRVLNAILSIRQECLGREKILGTPFVGVESEEKAMLPFFRKKIHPIELIITLSASQLALLLLVAINGTGLSLTWMIMIVVLAVISYYIFVYVYVNHRLRDMKPVIEGLEAKSK